MDLLQKILKGNPRVSQRTSQSEPVYFVVVGEDNHPTVLVTHFDVAPFAVQLDEAKPFERRNHLPAGYKGQSHSASSTTSWSASSLSSSGSGSR